MQGSPAAGMDMTTTTQARRSHVETMIAQVALGDRAAFDALYAATSGRLYAICLSVLKDRVEAEEALRIGLADRVVVLNFWGSWCGPCRQVSPALEKVATERAGKLKLVKVDVDAAPETARKFSVQAVPTLLILNQGNVLSRQSGAAPPDVLLRWVDEALQKKADSASGAP